MPRYKAVLFTPDGDWVTDYRFDTIEEVQDALADRGSTWFFYPFEGVIRDNGNFTSKRQKIVDMAPPYVDFKGRTIAALSRELKQTPEAVMRYMLGG